MKEFFTIGQVVQSCGLSRATILRLEEKGLLKPARIDVKSGYRYYDNHNVSQIMQIKHLLELGLTYDNILLYYQTNGNPSQLLKLIEPRFYSIKRIYDEIRIRNSNVDDTLEFKTVILPEYICLTRDFRGATTDDKYKDMYGLYHEAVERGYRLLASEPLFVINHRDDYLRGEYSTKNVIDYTCCIPLEPDSAPDDAVTYPSCRALSCIYCGDYSRLGNAYNGIGQKLKDMDLKPAGDIRGLGLVASYTGRDIPMSRYVSLLALPIEA